MSLPEENLLNERLGLEQKPTVGKFAVRQAEMTDDRQGARLPPEQIFFNI
jgi:hypothetical protein